MSTMNTRVLVTAAVARLRGMRRVAPWLTVRFPWSSGRWWPCSWWASSSSSSRREWTAATGLGWAECEICGTKGYLTLVSDVTT